MYLLLLIAFLIMNLLICAGHHEVEYNTQNISSGFYFYRIEAGLYILSIFN
jgi:hypothetical protein